LPGLRILERLICAPGYGLAMVIEIVYETHSTS